MSSTQPASCRIGDYLVTVLSDGYMEASLSLLSGIGETDAQAIQTEAGIAAPGNIEINGFLIRGRSHTILVDSGTGGMNNAGGQLLPSLQKAGVTPDDIDTILLTHCHPDHIGGLLDSHGNKVFNRATLFLHPLEAEYWLDDTHQQAATERGKRNFAFARQVLKTYGEQRKFFSDGDVIEGISPVLLAGHTPGHTGFHIKAENGGLLIWGDIVHFPYIQSMHPDVFVAFDVDHIQAEQTRAQIFSQAATQQLLVAGMHFAHAGFAHIHPSENGYRIEYLQG